MENSEALQSQICQNYERVNETELKNLNYTFKINFPCYLLRKYLKGKEKRLLLYARL